MDEEIQYNSNPGLTQRFLSLGAERGGVVCINTPFALFCTKEMPRKGAVKVELSVFPPSVSLVRDKESSKLGRNEIFNTNGCQVPDEQMSK